MKRSLSLGAALLLLTQLALANINNDDTTESQFGMSSPSAQTARQSPFYAALGVAFSTGSDFKADDLSVTNGPMSGTGSSTMKADGVATILGELGLLNSNDFGFDVGLSYDTARSIKTVTVSGDAATTAAVADKKPSIALLTAALNGNITYRKLTLKAGLNMTKAMASGSDADYQLGLGAQAGVAVLVKENLMIELLLRRSTFKASEDTGATHIDYGTVYLDSFQLGLKFLL